MLKIILILFLLISNYLFCEEINLKYLKTDKFEIVQNIDLGKDSRDYYLTIYGKMVFEIQVFKNKETQDLYLVSYCEDADLINKL
ncbi:hypothetical protein EOM39_01135 [Candidatus Gracilibacteria bacterium]|nr:hypothetical protein [Candidatus Gracilibacteria bacterium]